MLQKSTVASEELLKTEDLWDAHGARSSAVGSNSLAHWSQTTTKLITLGRIEW